MYEKTTDNVRVSVEPAYLDDQSSPEDRRYVWAYRVRIENCGRESVRLRSRYWRITDANGFMQEVSGEGVVGDQPILKPGENYEYTSGAPLTTPSGFMVGNYTMEGENGRYFTVDIPAFSLDSPHQYVVLN
jgi:ApaG protein